MNNRTNFDNLGIRVAAYIRVSTEEQKLYGLSIDAQTAALEDWAKKNDLKIARFYNDAGFSARKPYHKRPAMVQLLEDVQAKKIDLIIFTKLDRWFRSLPDYFKVQEILEKYHVNWRTIQEDYDTSTASGRLKINIMLSVAQDEADRTSERIKAVFETKRQKMEPLTGQMPFGYIIEKNKIVKDPKTEEAVALFFRSYLESGSISAAQRDVMEHCAINLNYQRVHRMLDSPAYCGQYFGVDGMTPPYLTNEEFEKIQSMRRRTVRKSTRNHIFLFSGLAVCAECGRRMGTRRSTLSDYQYYTCPSRSMRPGSCSSKVCINEKTIQNYILDTLESKVQDFKFEWEKNAAERSRKNYKPEIAAIRGKISRLKDLYLNELISLEEYKSDHAAYTNRLTELLEMDKPLVIPDFKALEKLASQEWKDRYQELSKEGKRKAWRLIIREIRVYPDRRIEFDLNV